MKSFATVLYCMSRFSTNALRTVTNSMNLYWLSTISVTNHYSHFTGQRASMSDWPLWQGVICISQWTRSAMYNLIG